MYINEILDFANLIKSSGDMVFTNYYNKYNSIDDDLETIERKNTIVFFVKEELVTRVFFISSDLSELTECFEEVHGDFVMDYVCKSDVNPIEDCFVKGGWKPYDVYLRTMYLIRDVKERTDKSKNELLLEKMYNPDLGYPAGEEDIPAIRTLMMNVFDPYNSEIPTVEELSEAVEKKSIWIYKYEGEICTLYMYRIEGKKRYGVMTYNSLSADYLYSVCQRANELSENENELLMHYGWIREGNQKIRRRLDSINRMNFDGMKNFIYRKSE